MVFRGIDVWPAGWMDWWFVNEPYGNWRDGWRPRSFFVVVVVVVVEMRKGGSCIAIHELRSTP